MDVISVQFILLSVVSAIVFYLLNHKYRAAYLSLVSLGFIATLSYYLVAYVLAYALVNYYFGLKIPDAKNKIRLYRLGIVINLTQLILLKYASWSIDPMLELFGSSLVFSRLSDIIIPLGISYFTLQGIGYLINVKMGWEKPESRFFDFLVYITWFPKFLSGPIERSNHFLPQLKERQVFDESRVSEGLRIALFGFFKKVAIANQLAPHVVEAFTTQTSMESLSPWVMFLLLPMYLYFDFSGYTDIAIGFSRIFGINILPNFNRPFFSENMTMFWKRFHITLGAWFLDYIFRQTVFRRRKWGIYASVYGTFITFMLFGIWHGAGWNFMLLGLLQVVALNYEFLTRKWRYKFFSKLPPFFRKWLARISTYLFFCVSMVFFFAPDLEAIGIFFSKLASSTGFISLEGISLKPFQLLIYIPLFMLVELIQNDFEDTFKVVGKIWYGDNLTGRITRWTVYTIVISIIFVAGLSAEQFVYVNF
jgi:D-alanyl-lipoteichoic acid acyltransferase DltB (MBOAT superfamily)